MLDIAVIVGSTRPGRKADAVAKWVLGIAEDRGDARFELVDVADFALPLLDEAVPPAMAEGKYSKPHSLAWAVRIEKFDGYVFVSPEYNHGTVALRLRGLRRLQAGRPPDPVGPRHARSAHPGSGALRALRTRPREP